MSPEVAEAVRKQTGCGYCGAGEGDRCTNTRGEPVAWIHNRRVQDNLFRHPTKKGPTR